VYSLAEMIWRKNFFKWLDMAANFFWISMNLIRQEKKQRAALLCCLSNREEQ
jgi:hypothetical protein